MRKTLFFLFICCAEGFSEPLLHFSPQKINESYFYVDGELLYWTAEVANLSYAFQNEPIPGGGTEVTKLFSVDYDWNPGFRLQASYKFKDYWDLTANFTSFQTHGKDSIAPPSNGSIVEAFNPSAGSITQGKSKIDLSYNLLHVDLGRKHISQQNLLLRFITGAVFAWIDQKWDNFFNVSNPLTNPSSVKSHSDLFGGGIRFCAEGDFKVWKGFSLIGNLSIATLYSGTKNRITAQYGAINSNDTDLKFNLNKINPMMGLVLGMQWSTPSEDSYVFQLSTGYELTYWWNLNQVLVRRQASESFDNTVSGPLSLQGLFIRTGLYF